jgi:betaine-aldehyde dehydrogenase
MVSINGLPQACRTQSGGFKAGVGCEMGPEGFRAFLETRSIAVTP